MRRISDVVGNDLCLLCPQGKGGFQPGPYGPDLEHLLIAVFQTGRIHKGIVIPVKSDGLQMDIEYPDGIRLKQDIGVHGCIEGGIERDPAVLDNGIFTESSNPKSLPVGWIVGEIHSTLGKKPELSRDVFVGFPAL